MISYAMDDNGNFGGFLNASTQNESQSGISSENILDRWSSFISSLPSRFPRASARLLLHCISAIGTAALRDITMANGASYGHWWVLKIFVDEMTLWLAEMGGFLDPSVASASSMTARAFQSPVMEHAGNGRSQSGSQISGHGPDRESGASELYMQSQQHRSASQQTQADLSGSQHQASMHFHRRPDSKLQHQTRSHHENDVDDSGIGMSMVEDDLPMSKYGMSGAHMENAALAGHVGVQVEAL